MKLIILFGSQTGTAEVAAHDLAYESSRRLISTEVYAIDEFVLSDIFSISLVIFIVSTTGQGEPPDNMAQFWKAIMSDYSTRKQSTMHIDVQMLAKFWVVGSHKVIKWSSHARIAASWRSKPLSTVKGALSRSISA